MSKQPCHYEQRKSQAFNSYGHQAKEPENCPPRPYNLSLSLLKQHRLESRYFLYQSHRHPVSYNWLPFALCVFMRVHIHMRAHRCEGQRSVSGLFLICLLSCFGTGCFPATRGFTRQFQLAGQVTSKDSIASASTLLESQVCITMPSFLHRFWGLNSRPD